MGELQVMAWMYRLLNLYANEIKNIFESENSNMFNNWRWKYPFRGIKGAAEGIDRSTSDYMGMLSNCYECIYLCKVF